MSSIDLSSKNGAKIDIYLQKACDEMKIKRTFARFYQKGKKKGSSMKRQKVAVIAIFVASAIVIAGCVARQQEQAAAEAEERADSLNVDSLLSAADTLLLDKETEFTPLPSTVDEFFGDFIFNFDQSNRLQRNRIKFPLTVKEADGTSHAIGRNDWKHHYLFLQQDYCTVLWPSRKDMDLAQDTSLTKAHVEQIYLHSRQLHDYQFERDSTTRQWYLTQESIIPLEKSELQAFCVFYNDFVADSVYQRHHVNNPLRYTTYEEESGYAPISGTIDADQWFEFQPDMPTDVLVNINYGQRYQHPSRIHMEMRGINNGMQCLFSFQRDGDHWRLTAFEN